LVAALNAGADAFVSKPVDFGELQAHLKVAERILRLEDQVAAAAEERAQLRELRAIAATARTLTDRINNAMMVIYGQCERLRSGIGSLAPEEVSKAAERALAAAAAVSQVVHDLQRVVRPVMSEVPGVGAVLDLQQSTTPSSEPPPDQET
ncbi:MAG: hypothetical protein QHJ73_19545, partial [Armatimonadota bacterium]|nr:hypothetical protein [Armatimonadota bacterium]